MLPPRALPRQVLRVSAGRSIPRALSQPAFPRAPLLSPLSLVTSETLHPVEVPSELLDRFEYRHRPGLTQLGRPEAAGQDRYRRHTRATGRLDVPGRVADHQPAVRARLGERRVDEIGLRLGRLDVGRGGPVVGELARIEEVEVTVDLAF